MKSVEWKTYRTRFLVKAKQLSSALSFIDHLGRQHCGRKGDYLVESFDGVLSIAPRQIFEDIYVLMSQMASDAAEISPEQSDVVPEGISGLEMKPLRVERLEIETIERPEFPRVQVPARRRTDQVDPSRARRKSPQPVRSNRAPSHLSLM